MIRWPLRHSELAADERYALEVLVDLARIVPLEEGVDGAREEWGVVRLAVVDDGKVARGISDWVAAGWGIEPADGGGEIRIPRGALRAIAAVAGAGLEQRATGVDRYGRVPSAANPLVAAGLEREPVISQAAERLRAVLISCAGRRPLRVVAPWPQGRSWAAAFTHDLDVVSWWPLSTGVRLAELLRKGEWSRAGRVLAAAVGAVGRGPVVDGVRRVLARERALGVRSTWFVLCGSPTLRTVLAGDLTYRPESVRARRILAAIEAGGNEIGLHGSRATVDDVRAFVVQRDRLAALAGRSPIGVRQHFLRMRPGETQERMSVAGFRYDATYGFPDRSGFRLGVADVVPAWSEAGRRPIGLEEVPLVWMDRSLSKYGGVEDPDAWVGEALELARACRSVGGLWVGLWHPNLTPPLGFPGAPEAFDRIVGAVMEWEPYVAPLAEIVAWRVARRGVRVEALRPDGEVVVRSREGSPHPVVLVDGDGRLSERG